jgi:hypothetical protein
VYEPSFAETGLIVNSMYESAFHCCEKYLRKSKEEIFILAHDRLQSIVGWLHCFGARTFWRGKCNEAKLLTSWWLVNHHEREAGDKGTF